MRPRLRPHSEVDRAPRFAELLSCRVTHTVTTWLGEFGAKTPKCVKLWSDDPFVQHLRRTGHMTQHVVLSVACYSMITGACVRTLRRGRFPTRSDTTVRYQDRKGKMRYKGSSTLKGSQTYPPGFGRAVSWHIL